MPHPVHAAVFPQQRTGADAVPYLLCRDAGVQELRARNHAVLPRGEPREHRLHRGRLVVM